MAAPSDGRRLDLKLGFSCNNHCVFCVQGDKRERLPDRDTAEVMELLEAWQGRAQTVVLTGGEPTLREDVVEVVDRARALGYERIQLQTNGRRLSYRPYLEALMEAGLSEAMISLHGSCAAIHDELTASKGAFHQVVRGLKNAREAGLPVVTNSVVLKGNYSDLPRLAELLVEVGGSTMQWGWVHAIGTAGTWFRQVVPRYSVAMPFLRRAMDVGLAAGRRVLVEAVPDCFLEGYEECVLERHVQDSAVLDGHRVQESFGEWRVFEGKAHGPPCERCSFREVCEGPWREYPEELGWEEFVSRTDDPGEALGA